MTLPLVARRNATLEFSFQITEPNGAATDLTGCTIRMHFRRKGESSPVLQLGNLDANGQGLSAPIPSSGAIDGAITHTTLQSLALGPARFELDWDLLIIRPTGQRVVPENGAGTLLVLEGVTQ